MNVRSWCLLPAAAVAAASLTGAAQQPGAEPALTRRDPLVPPPALYTSQDLPAVHVTLIGVDRQAPDRPLAVLRLESRPPVRRVVRPGDRIGEYRVLAIEPARVRVAAPTFGGSTVLDLAVRDSSIQPR